MKKFLLTLAIVVSAFFGAQTHAEWITKDNIGEKLLFYIPNRIVDALDFVSVSLGVGPIVEARLMATRAIDVGLGIGMDAKAYKLYNRQYGFGLEEGWYWSFICLGEEDFSVFESVGFVSKYTETRAGFPEPTQRVYDFFDGARDYWAFGGALGLLVDGELYVHPVELADFVLGFFLIDIKDDDFTLEDIK